VALYGDEVLTAPRDLDESALTGALLSGWDIDVRSMTYLAVGWGSHHWDVRGGNGARWFVTVDELENKRASGAESLDQGFGRLRASLRSAVALRDAGCEFVVAPVPARGGEPTVRAGGRFAVAVYPFTNGHSAGWGKWTVPMRSAVVAMLARVHAAPPQARRHALDEDFGVPFREQLEAACSGWEPAERGPYTAAAARLLRAHAAPVGQWLSRYDGLAGLARARPGRNVLTHGEPHPGNVMLTSDGWRLIDWDTVLCAPPERDLWHLEPGDGSALHAYAAATRVEPLPDLVELYRLGWDIKDMAYDAARFFRPHSDSADDVKSWELLSSLVRRAGE
jgi:spectinomycin phosphotransferase/16S rRNA (guanine(1405)-N(7))-methyltransferase